MIFHRTDRTETLPPYPILICTTFGISAKNFMLLSTDARFLQFQQLMECTSCPPSETQRPVLSIKLSPWCVHVATMSQGDFSSNHLVQTTVNVWRLTFGEFKATRLVVPVPQPRLRILVVRRPTPALFLATNGSQTSGFTCGELEPIWAAVFAAAFADANASSPCTLFPCI